MFLAVMGQFDVMEWTKLENDSNTETTNFTEEVASFASYIATALPVNSVNVNSPAKKIMYHPWNLGGLNPSFFGIWGGLAPPSPCVEPPLELATLQRVYNLEGSSEAL